MAPYVIAQFETPRLSLLGDCLTPDECEQLILLSRPSLAPAMGYDPLHGTRGPSDTRIAQETLHRRNSSSLIIDIQNRFSRAVDLPLVNFEEFHVIRYTQGELFNPHFDCLYSAEPTEHTSEELANGGQRIFTFLIYLNSCMDGGETFFPNLNLKIQPHQGRAIFMKNTVENRMADPLTLHGGLPMGAGEKWIAIQFIRESAHTETLFKQYEPAI